ncbi:helix-turn-helix transcriptional regulator [Pseudomonas gingeri]|uniref:Helix-turn-helix transcriptional regulator n=1 Tax=Pseudomonas gingeri TaxID=117681 RepID=A0A7Y7XBX2_9PSED|nr:helix-turn-helix transcriptional regulator [Pseudomonas gingeri]NWA24496.1 helix-turn-helix transcriptional regulator [Pseudomonas gingeri]NWB96896.1 helix-turn-helix transcriptional regulator [Pseudomonas gingeri]NWD67102.1 helix-turn-helix transcriptional regulator [Pseudomonas gingeri]NWD77480.1 helix-turn-helix transcriptional regulator [Pseudomonas gingeri]
MKLTHDLGHGHDPYLYLRLGELVSSAAEDAFAEHMLAFVNSLVPIHGLDLSEWTLDADRGSIGPSKCLGSAGQVHDICAPNTLPHPLLQSVLEMEAPLLIQLKTPANRQHPEHSAHQCNLVSGSGDLRWVICFHRMASLQAFSVTELSMLKSLSDTLLPLVVHRAQLLAPPGTRWTGAAQAGSEHDALHQAFSARLAQDAINLSAREQEVCLGLLTGITVSEMAQRLNVKNSSVETYLKRATTKLGVSGRHGLTRWMAFVPSRAKHVPAAPADIPGTPASKAGPRQDQYG